MAYVIDIARCSSCGKCLEACPMEAISLAGDDQFCIDPAICTDCGTCADVCPENAICGS